ncbi:hypothetical protein FACS189434_10960 [Bacteroidia bacterium]|nr:hypothetical protein FACS189434_10960 [Bacteroidia bacterium]
MRNTIYILLFIVCASCTSNKTTKQEIITLDSSEVSVSEEYYDVLTSIHRVIDSVGFVTFPYKIYYQQISIHINDDKLMRYLQPYMPADGRLIYGVLPDTTNFYELIVDAGAAIYEPYLITFDKKGNFVDKKKLIEDNCYEMAGESVSCDEYIIINEDLTLFYYYNSKHLFDGIDDNGVLVCEHYEKKGHISKDGKIVFEKRQEFPVENCDTINQIIN